MYIAYSALRDPDMQQQTLTDSCKFLQQVNTPKMQGYLAACVKYRSEIDAIQQYIPGWLPSLPTP